MAPGDATVLIIPCLFIVAFLYASVGHGGASGYLALMVLFGIQPDVMRSSALLFNVFVSGVAFYQFWRGGHFRLGLFLPFILSSVPAAFIGSYITIDPGMYKKILGALLILPILRLFLVPGSDEEGKGQVPFLPALAIGAPIGFISGMIGIGGGIILSPVILLMKWGNMRETAAVSALFIFVNSLSGISGLLLKGASFGGQVQWWLPAVILGGAAGAFLGSSFFRVSTLRGFLALVLMTASIKLLIT